MMNGYVASQIKRCNRQLFIFNLVIFVVVLVLAHKFYYNIVFGPFTLDSNAVKTLSTEKKLGDKYYYRVSSKKIFENEIQEKTYYNVSERRLILESGSKVTAYYKILAFKKKLFLVKVSDKSKDKIFTGILVPIKREIDDANIRKSFCRYVLDTTYYYKWNMFMDFASTFGFLLIAFINIFKSIYRTFKPEAHPIYKKIKKYFGNPEETIANINSEVNGEKVFKSSGTVITPNWIIKNEFFLIKVTRNNEYEFKD
jgi:hypothetical protein